MHMVLDYMPNVQFHQQKGSEDLVGNPLGWIAY